MAEQNTSLCDVAIFASLWRKDYRWKSGIVKVLDTTTHKSSKILKKNDFVHIDIQAKCRLKTKFFKSCLIRPVLTYARVFPKIKKKSWLIFTQSWVNKDKSWLKKIPFFVIWLFSFRYGGRIFVEDQGLSKSLSPRLIYRQ